MTEPTQASELAAAGERPDLWVVRHHQDYDTFAVYDRQNRRYVSPQRKSLEHARWDHRAARWCRRFLNRHPRHLSQPGGSEAS